MASRRAAAGARAALLLLGLALLDRQTSFIAGNGRRAVFCRPEAARAAGRRLEPSRWFALCAKAGDEVGGFLLQEPLGTGSFGTTWQAAATERCDEAMGLRDGEVVALKLIRLQDGWTMMDKLEREASVLQRLRHPGVPVYHGSLVHDHPGGQDLGLVSDIVRGKTLEEEVRSGRWAATPENLRLLTETLLDVCVHLASFAPPVVHRDIKPANILLEEVPGNSSERRWKIFLVDFGSAVLGSGTRTAAGTFGYMAPESFGNSFSPKSDLYSVGATLLFAAAGLEPGALPQERLQVKFQQALVGTVWERNELWLARMLERMLAPAPEDRFSSAAEALSFLRGEPMEVSTEVTVEPPRGSQIAVKREGGELQVLFPPGKVNVELGAFSVAWTSFTAFWTAGVLSAGAPFMALFSLPFWATGVRMLKDTLSPLRGAVELRISSDRWTLGRVDGKLIDQGKTAGLRCTSRAADMAGTTLVLQEGAEEVLVQQRLSDVEAEWLEALISDQIANR